jgi:hypothetical protein
LDAKGSSCSFDDEGCSPGLNGGARFRPWIMLGLLPLLEGPGRLRAQAVPSRMLKNTKKLDDVGCLLSPTFPRRHARHGGRQTWTEGSNLYPNFRPPPHRAANPLRRGPRRTWDADHPHREGGVGRQNTTFLFPFLPKLLPPHPAPYLPHGGDPRDPLTGSQLGPPIRLQISRGGGLALIPPPQGGPFPALKYQHGHQHRTGKAGRAPPSLLVSCHPRARITADPTPPPFGISS